MTVVVEACVESVAESVAAEQGGAHRLELCANLAVGGTTPPSSLIETVKQRVGIRVVAMVRPRGGSFVHSSAELQQMHADLDRVLEAGADEVVLGILNDDDSVNAEATRALVRRAGGVQVTFHKAFDETRDLAGALETLIDCGIARVLTSGGAPTAAQGAAVLADLVRRSAGRIAIMAGGRVRPDNVSQIVRATGVENVHARSDDDGERVRGILRALS